MGGDDDHFKKAIAEILSLLRKPDVQLKIDLLKQLEGLTGSQEGLVALSKHKGIIRHLLRYIGDSNSVIDQLTITCLINLSEYLYDEMIERNIVTRLMDTIFDEKENAMLPLYIALLANITRYEKGSARLLTTDVSSMRGYYVHKMMTLLSQQEEDEKDRFGWILTIFNNITQIKDGRDILLENQEFLKNIAKNIDHSNVIRRRGALGTISNLLFNSDYHEKLLSDPDLNILLHILTPIRGGKANLDEDDKNGMFEALKDVDENKQFEPDAECRDHIINCLSLFAATRFGRDYMKQHKTYPIVRELDKVEENEKISEKIFDLVHILLLDDPEDNPEPEPVEEPPKSEVKKQLDLDEMGEEIEEL